MIKHLWTKWIIHWHGKSFRTFWHNTWTFPKHFYKFVKEVCFLLKYGYPYEATYEHFNWFLDMERSILKRYLETHWGYPGQEGADTNEEWEAVIKRMIELLDGMDEEKYENENEWDGKKDTALSYERDKIKYLEKNKNEFFELYSKWFYDMWD